MFYKFVSMLHNDCFLELFDHSNVSFSTELLEPSVVDSKDVNNMGEEINSLYTALLEGHQLK